MIDSDTRILTHPPCTGTRIDEEQLQEDTKQTSSTERKRREGRGKEHVWSRGLASAYVVKPKHLYHAYCVVGPFFSLKKKEVNPVPWPPHSQRSNERCCHTCVIIPKRCRPVSFFFDESSHRLFIKPFKVRNDGTVLFTKRRVLLSSLILL